MNKIKGLSQKEIFEIAFFIFAKSVDFSAQNAPHLKFKSRKAPKTAAAEESASKRQTGKTKAEENSEERSESKIKTEKINL